MARVGLAPDFDRIARAYRLLEYLSLGALLELTRNQFLPSLNTREHALILGDGDGRFTARLLRRCPALQAEVVDLSPAMLRQLSRRCQAQQSRLQVHAADARVHLPRGRPDLVVTHFFLDCLAEAEVESLIAGLAPRLAPAALWVVSEFRIPDGFVRPFAWLYVRLLYLAFALLTGLSVTELPEHSAAFKRNGFVLVASRRRLFGMLSSELWQARPQPPSSSSRSSGAITCPRAYQTSHGTIIQKDAYEEASGRLG